MICSIGTEASNIAAMRVLKGHHRCYSDESYETACHNLHLVDHVLFGRTRPGGYGFFKLEWDMGAKSSGV